MKIEWIDVTKLKGDDVEELWKNLAKVDRTHDDRLRNRWDYFVASLFNGTQWFKLGDMGVACVSGVVPGMDASVHVVIWDKDNPTEVFRLIKDALKFVFEEFALQRVTTQVPEFNESTIRTAKLLGFQEEGRLRDGSILNGQLYPTIILGLLRKEFLSEEVN